MRACVIDTNVMVVANGDHNGEDDLCQLACIQALERLQRNGTVVIDDPGHIFNEYIQQLSLAGHPGVGNAFFKFIYDNQYNDQIVERASITLCDDHRVFEQFPGDPDLITFDRSDRKFVAAARASRNSPVILNAVDSDWREHAEALRRYVEVMELCEFAGVD